MDSRPAARQRQREAEVTKTLIEQRTDVARVRTAAVSLSLLMACLFVLVPAGLFRFTFPKLAFLAVGLGVGLIAGSRTKLAPHTSWGAAAVLAAFALATTLADGLGSSFWGRWPRYEGVPTVAAYLLLLPVGARLLGPGANPAVRLYWTRLLSGSLALLAAAALAAAWGWNVMGDSAEFRFGATLGNATDLGIVGLTGAAVLLPRAIWTKTPWDVAGAFAGGIVAVASGSRAVIIVLAILIVAVIGWLAWQKGGTSRWRPAVLWLVATMTPAAVAILAFPDVRERLLTSGTVSGRVDLWGATWALIQQNLLFGVGPGRFVDALPAYQSEEFAVRVGTDYPADSPHLIALQWLVDGGVPLLLANAFLCAAVLWVGARNIKATHDVSERLFLVGAMGAVCSFGLVLLTHFPNTATTVIAGLCAGALSGVGLSAPSTGTKAKKTTPARTKKRIPVNMTRVATMGVLGCLTAMAAAAWLAATAEIPLKAGNAAVRDGRLEDASTEFDSAAALRPWDVDVALLAGQAFAGRAAAGDPASGLFAVQWSARSLQANPGSVESLTSLAVGQLASGDVSGARNTLAQARLAAPVNSQVWLQSGLAEYAAGRTDTALAYVGKAVSLTPDPEEERAILGALQQAAGQP